MKSPDTRAVFLLATLKHKRGGGEFSHTETLCELVVENLRAHGVRSEIVRLVEYDIPPGTKSNMGKGDDWGALSSRCWCIVRLAYLCRSVGRGYPTPGG